MILDRRRSDETATDRDAALAERREPLTSLEQDQWLTLGFRMVHRGEDLEVYEAARRPESGAP
ncbi:MAG: hypothetical protein ACRELA_16860 [Candidatus Rokuibacteriota bacterium]